MFCKKCGAEIRDTANFCPKCGTVCSMKTTNNTKKKQHSRIIALMTSLVLLLGACSGVFIFQEEIFRIFSKNEDIYSAVDEKIDLLFSSDYYVNLTMEGKVDTVQKLLEELESEGKVQEKSIQFDEDSNMFWFKYLDSTDSGIMLEDFNSGYSGNAQVNDYVKWESPGIVKSFNDIIDLNSSGYPFSKTEIDNLNLTALYMFGLCNKNDTNSTYYKYLQEYYNNQRNWNSNCLKTDIDAYCTVEDFKTELLGYNLIIIEEHGNISYKNYPMICTLEEVTKDTKIKYLSEDFSNLSPVRQTDGKRYWWIKPSFFEKYYGNDGLKDSIVWIGSCHGYENDKLVNAFSNCGAKAVIGYTNSVLTGYDSYLHSAFVYSLMFGDTVSEALKFAQSVWYKNDQEFWYAYKETNSKFGSIIKKSDYHNTCATATIYPGGGEARLINLKNQSTISGCVTDEAGNPIENAEVTAAITLSDTIANKKVKTDSNGYYQIACSPGNYKIKVTADGYEDYSSDEVINVENDFETMMDTIVLKKKEIIPEIVQAVLDNETLWLNPLNEISNYGYNECWFQDIDMDGTPEFITGGNVQGAHAAHCFYIYHLENGELKPMENNYGSNEIDFWTGGSKDGYAGFVCQLYKDNNTGTYKYVYINEDGVATESYRMLLELSAAKTSGGKTVFNTLNILTITEKSDLTYSYTGTGNDAIDITKEEMLRLYDDYFKGLIAYKTTVYAIPCSKISADKPGYYDTMSLEDKKQTLLDSYNAWNYEENSYAELPLSNIIKNLNANEYLKTEMKTSESDLKEKANGIDNIIEWYCDDFDNDGNVEAFCLTGEKTDYGDEIEKLIFFNNESDFSLIGTSFWGVYAQCRVVEYKDIKYFIFDTHNGGSGSTTYVYYVVNNNYKEASCSGQIHGFVVDETGAYSFESGSGAHERPRINLKVDETSHDIIIE